MNCIKNKVEHNCFLFPTTTAEIEKIVKSLKSKNSKEIIGQVIRIIASFLFTIIWVPKGNTGGTNVSLNKKMPIRKELKKYF